ncbi:hypothetical protein Tco_1141700 [Tanacetum coccineum]
MNVYSHKVNPVNGRDMWAKFECPTTLLPQKVNPQIGRPPKKRKKSKGEIEMVKATTMPKKTMGRKRSASQPGNEASTQGSQASAGSTFKRTKMTTSRLTPDKSKK